MATTAGPDPDEPVIEAIQQGDHGAFRDLLRRQDRWVRGIVYSVLGDSQRVDDVTQQVWTTVWERSGELRDAKRWRPWLARLARNAAVDAGRDTTRRRKLSGALSPDVEPVAEKSDDIERDEQRRQVREAIDALPPIYREVLTLRHLEGWSYKQIAEVLDVPVDTVETRLVRARRKLRDALQGMV